MIIHGFINNGDLQTAYALFGEMTNDPDVIQDIAVYDTMMRGFLNDGDLESAWMIFEASSDIDRDFYFYKTLISGLCKNYIRKPQEEREKKFAIDTKDHEDHEDHEEQISVRRDL
tara:strand:- start:2085 stop:2429 length:345 start_codon:yes stop_codon:yes gene_type:complete